MLCFSLGSRLRGNDVYYPREGLGAVQRTAPTGWTEGEGTVVVGGVAVV